MCVCIFGLVVYIVKLDLCRKKGRNVTLFLKAVLNTLGFEK